MKSYEIHINVSNTCFPPEYSIPLQIKSKDFEINVIGVKILARDPQNPHLHEKAHSHRGGELIGPARPTDVYFEGSDTPFYKSEESTETLVAVHLDPTPSHFAITKSDYFGVFIEIVETLERKSEPASLKNPTIYTPIPKSKWLWQVESKEPVHLELTHKQRLVVSQMALKIEPSTPSKVIEVSLPCCQVYHLEPGTSYRIDHHSSFYLVEV